MSEEIKDTKTCPSCSKAGGKLLAGGVLVVIGLILVIKFFGALMTVFAGCIGVFLILAGAITIAIAKE